MQNGSISDLNNLKFYTDNGIEIYTEKQYTITWKYKNTNDKYRTLPEGFIIADIKPATLNDDESAYIIDSSTILIGFTLYPEIWLNTAIMHKSTNESPVWPLFILLYLQYNYVYDIRTQLTTLTNNIITITLHINDTQEVNFDIPADKFFGDTFEYVVKDLILGDMDNDYDDINEFKKYAVITNISVAKDETNDIPHLLYVLAGCPWTLEALQEAGGEAANQTQLFNILEIPESLDINGIHEITKDNITLNESGLFVPVNPDGYTDEELKYISYLSSGIALFFPFIKYQGVITQEKVSTDFYATNTLLILEEITEYEDDGTPNISYEYPALNADETNWNIIFQTPEEGELRILETDENISINPVLSTTRSLAVSDVQFDDDTVNPMYLCIGTISPNEGVFQNYLGLYLNNLNSDREYFFGVIAVHTEIIGEDERYRTLMENFGIPDPANYFNIFAENDYDEMLCNWDFINKKCKELMLIYPEIFPYANTYKGLINALKFLGYDDIIIKEWYNIIDKNGYQKNIAFESVDLVNGKLYSLLKNYNVEYTDDNKYHKLNLISLIYHINELINQDKITDLYLTINKKLDDGTYLEYKRAYSEYWPFDIPLTQPIYTYRTQEILAKLFSVKKWLETYIIGINVRITDITGEGIQFIPYKTNLYNNSTVVNDFITHNYVTPKILNVTPFYESKSTITCSLAEFNNITFNDYTHYTFDSFEKCTHDINVNTKTLLFLDPVHSDIRETLDVTAPTDKLHISNTLGSAIFGDEFCFELSTKPSSGSLSQYTSGDDQIIITESTIKFLKNTTQTVNFHTLPIIYFEDGFIRHINGNWEDNIAWTTLESKNNIDWTSAYYITPYNAHTKGHKIYTHVTLIPKENAELSYSADNKWQQPMFVMSNYKFAFYDESMEDAELYDIPEDTKFILDIQNGRFSFYNREDEISTDLLFFSPHDVDIRYTYRTDLQKVLNYNILPDKSSSSVIQKLHITANEYNTFITDALNLSNNINEFKQPFLLEKSKLFNPHPTKYKPVSIFDEYSKQYIIGYWDLDETDKYIDDTLENHYDISVVKYWIQHLLKVKAAEIQNNNIEIIDNMINNVVTYNTSISLDVNHIGEYDIIAKVYDRYNNIYINSGTRLAKILKPKPTFDIIINQDNSKNSKDFCKSNTNGELLSYEKISEFNDALTSPDEIKYIVKWPIYKINYDYQTPDTVNWWNYSYAVDNPKAGDYMWFRNTRFKVGRILGKKLYMYDALDCDRLFKQSDKLYGFLYDKNTQEILSTFTATINKEITLANEFVLKRKYMRHNLVDDKVDDEITQSDNLISSLIPDDQIIESPDLTESNLLKLLKRLNQFEYIISINDDNIISKYEDIVNNGVYELYVIPGLTYEFSKYTDNVLSQYFNNNYDNYTGSITIPNIQTQLFNISDVIKISYDVNIYNSFKINLPYNNSVDTNNALLESTYMSINPCLYMYNKNGHLEYTINSVNQYLADIQEGSTANIDEPEYVLFFKQYVNNNRLYCFYLTPKEKYTRTEMATLYNYSFNDAKNNVISNNNKNLIKAITSNIIFNENENTVDIIFPSLYGECINKIHNEVSTRIIQVQKNNIKNKQSIIPDINYTYITSECVDINLIKEYENNALYDLTISLSYPYQNFVQYLAPVKKDSTYDLYQYSPDTLLTQVSAYIDYEQLFLDSYIDSNFLGMTYDFNPLYINASFVPSSENIFLDENTDSYLYHNTSVTINQGQMLWIKPCLTISDHTFMEENEEPKKYFESVEEIQWEVYNEVFNPDDINDYQEVITSIECLYKIRNNSFIIKPKTIGSHTVKMNIWDKYGNILTNNYSGSFYVNAPKKEKTYY